MTGVNPPDNGSTSPSACAASVSGDSDGRCCIRAYLLPGTCQSWGSFSSCKDQGAAQQPGVDGGQHGSLVGLPLLEGAGLLQPGELVGMGLGFGQPGGGGGTEPRREVDLGDAPEPGGAEQPP